ncbi:MAG: MmcB family DNA repair protein [Steroidobacteraceae bacterium]
MREPLNPAASRAHLRRLRQYYRSAGWPCHDNLEVDLLVAGLAERMPADAAGVESIRVTEAGLAALAGYRQQNRHALDSHDALVARIAQQLVDEGRVVFRGVTLRAKVETGWKPVRPDVFSIRNTSHDAYLAPFVHEIKVSRADLMTDLRNAGKRAGYQALSQQFWYVIAPGIARPEEIPEDCGLIVAEPTGLQLLRPSPVREVRLATLHWLQLAKARAEFGAEEDGQMAL